MSSSHEQKENDAFQPPSPLTSRSAKQKHQHSASKILSPSRNSQWTRNKQQSQSQSPYTRAQQQGSRGRQATSSAIREMPSFSGEDDFPIPLGSEEFVMAGSFGDDDLQISRSASKSERPRSSPTLLMGNRGQFSNTFRPSPPSQQKPSYARPQHPGSYYSAPPSSSGGYYHGYHQPQQPQRYGEWGYGSGYGRESSSQLPPPASREFDNSSPKRPPAKRWTPEKTPKSQFESPPLSSSKKYKRSPLWGGVGTPNIGMYDTPSFGMDTPGGHLDDFSPMGPSFAAFESHSPIGGRSLEDRLMAVASNDGLDERRPLSQRRAPIPPSPGMNFMNELAPMPGTITRSPVRPKRERDGKQRHSYPPKDRSQGPPPHMHVHPPPGPPPQAPPTRRLSPMDRRPVPPNVPPHRRWGYEQQPPRHSHHGHVHMRLGDFGSKPSDIRSSLGEINRMVGGMAATPKPIGTPKMPREPIPSAHVSSRGAVTPYSAHSDRKEPSGPSYTPSVGKKSPRRKGKDKAEPLRRSPCNCKKSRCLKLYCECFAAEAVCDGCNCSDCRNNDAHHKERTKAIKDTRAKNPNAFKPRFVAARAAPITTGETSSTSASAAHSMGCKCKRSECLKKYCECFQAGVMCGSKCKCVDCLNFAGSQALIDKRRKIKDIKGAEYAMRIADETWKGKRPSGAPVPEPMDSATPLSRSSSLPRSSRPSSASSSGSSRVPHGHPLPPHLLHLTPSRRSASQQQPSHPSGHQYPHHGHPPHPGSHHPVAAHQPPSHPGHRPAPHPGHASSSGAYPPHPQPSSHPSSHQHPGSHPSGHTSHPSAPPSGHQQRGHPGYSHHGQQMRPHPQQSGYQASYSHQSSYPPHSYGQHARSSSSSGRHGERPVETPSRQYQHEKRGDRYSEHRYTESSRYSERESHRDAHREPPPKRQNMQSATVTPAPKQASQPVAKETPATMSSETEKPIVTPAAAANQETKDVGMGVEESVKEAERETAQDKGEHSSIAPTPKSTREVEQDASSTSQEAEQEHVAVPSTPEEVEQQKEKLPVLPPTPAAAPKHSISSEADLKTSVQSTPKTPRTRLGFDPSTSKKKRILGGTEPTFDYFGTLPEQPKTTALAILSYLPDEDVYNAALVSKQWSKLAMDEELWKIE